MKDNIPCIKDKCILFPVCKNKTEIKCEELYSYMKLDNAKKVRSVSKTLPKLYKIKGVK